MVHYDHYIIYIVTYTPTHPIHSCGRDVRMYVLMMLSEIVLVDNVEHLILHKLDSYS